MTAKYNTVDFTFETRTSNGMFYLTASAFDKAIQYEIKWDERKLQNIYIKQLLHDIRTGNVGLSKPDIHSHCAPSSLLLTHCIHTKGASFLHSYELKYTSNSSVDELIEYHLFLKKFQSDVKSLKSVMTTIKEKLEL